ncbi:hypothetical protein GW17_00045811 [Ensete ventricosum]|nr:hypothetical protein GW17_00045811 [Ensete ventricosum]
MAEGSAVADKPECATALASGLSRVESLFHRRIEFHRARKPYSSFSSSDGDFRLETLNPSLGLDRPAVSRGGAFPAGAPSPGKRSGEREFYEHGMDPELSFSITFRRINHVITALQSSGKILSPSHLVKNLRYKRMHMNTWLTCLNPCTNVVYHLESQVKCTQCSYSSSKFDPFVDLSLEIAKADSLQKALTHFTAVEQLDGGERQYQCQHCKEKVRALKQLTIHKAPYVLTIHLKRFSSYVPGQKIDKKVDFEPTLDLKPFLSDQHVCRYLSSDSSIIKMLNISV